MRSVLRFMDELAAHNDVAWMHAHKEAYARDVRQPLHALIEAVTPALRRMGLEAHVAPQHRDRRFRPDAPPYWPHALLRVVPPSVTRPQPTMSVRLGDACRFRAGLVRPPRSVADAVRARIVARPGDWTRATRGLVLDDDRLRRLPPAFDPGHRHAADLRLRSFVAHVELEPDDVVDPGFPDAFLAVCRQHAGLVRFIQKALA